MKKYNSAKYAALLAESLAENELPLADRSDRWWDLFWHYIAVSEAQRLKEKV